ncbi:unnamed protein product [Linum trigynum]|uniref:Uncharacterized protein n=1 Tax=Linum trigynum TaxID=586398 RepID=A0AAV2E960_9ROSI
MSSPKVGAPKKTETSWPPHHWVGGSPPGEEVLWKEVRELLSRKVMPENEAKKDPLSEMEEEVGAGELLLASLEKEIEGGDQTIGLGQDQQAQLLRKVGHQYPISAAEAWWAIGMMGRVSIEELGLKCVVWLGLLLKSTRRSLQEAKPSNVHYLEEKETKKVEG